MLKKNKIGKLCFAIFYGYLLKIETYARIFYIIFILIFYIFFFYVQNIIDYISFSIARYHYDDVILV